MTVTTLSPTPASIRPALAAIAARTRPLKGLTEHQLRWRPPSGWSVGQVLEHLVLSHEPYMPRMRTALGRGLNIAKAGSIRMWKPTMLGGLIVKSLTRPAKVKTRRKFDPGPEAGPGAAARFLATIAAMDEMIEAAVGADLRVRFASPVAAIVRPNLGDAFLLLTVHALRHLDQIDRIMAQTGFPTGE